MGSSDWQTNRRRVERTHQVDYLSCLGTNTHVSRVSYVFPPEPFQTLFPEIQQTPASLPPQKMVPSAFGRPQLVRRYSRWEATLPVSMSSDGVEAVVQKVFYILQVAIEQ